MSKGKAAGGAVMCTAACKHARDIADGDFFCDVADDVTIVGFCPMECPCPKKRKEAKSGGQTA